MLRQARHLHKGHVIGFAVVCEVSIASDFVLVVLDDGDDRIIRKFAPKEFVN